MLDRFIGAEGKRLRVEALLAQRIARGSEATAAELESKSEFIAVASGTTLIRQDGADNDLYFLVSGTFGIVINGHQIATRGPGELVGEMAAIQPAMRRSASVVALQDAVVAKVSEVDFTHIASRNPILYRFIAQELASRLEQRNRLINNHREKIKVFIISSAESLRIARAVQSAFEYDGFLCTVWTDGVFKVASYTLEALEQQIDDSDFAIAIAHADDIVAFRGQDWPSPRDNIVFELGLFMGRLGRERAILMEPREDKVKLPSDMAGITTIPYRFEAGQDEAALLAPACNKLREHIQRLGPNNG